MVQASVEHDATRPSNDEPPRTELEWREIFVSLAKLQTGLQKVQTELVQMRAELEAFRKSLDGAPEAEIRR